MDTHAMDKSKEPSGSGGYPRSLVPLLRCHVDGAELDVASSTQATGGLIHEGSLQCRVCNRTYPITGGIVRMLDEAVLDAEGSQELRMRDAENESAPVINATPEAEYRNELEMSPTLKALDVSPEHVILELGCGAGRYSTVLADKCRALLAVDFSLSALKAIAATMQGGAEVGLVQADITRLRVAAGKFDRALSTTCLDNRDQRMAMHRLVSDALSDEGRFVFGNEYYNLHIRLRGIPKVTRYSPQGMLFCHVEKEDVKRETAPFFKRVHVRPILVPTPFVRRIGIGYRGRRVLARLGEWIPVLRDMGALLLVQAEKPIRIPKEGECAPGNRLATVIFQWYQRKSELV
jgi:uncharacterized protein YbaR (Trm112 family)/protein-L-isoaspartate O-methyltransferase